MDKQFLSGCVCASECIPRGTYVMLCYAAIFLHAYYQFNKNSDKTRNWCSMFFPLAARFLFRYVIWPNIPVLQRRRLSH